MKLRIIAASAAVAVLLAGCAATTSLQSVHPRVDLSVQDKKLGTMPVNVELKTTTFGNYEFKAIRADGKSLYGILPLKFNGGYLAMNILLFAPASFFNLREPYPHYEFDVDQGVIKYRGAPNESWIETRPTPEEAQRARKYFGDA